MRAKLTAKHPRPTTPERAPVRRGSTTARKTTRPAPASATAGKPATAGAAAKRAGASARPAQTRAPRDAAAPPARPRRTGDAEPGARRDSGKPAFGRGAAGGERTPRFAGSRERDGGERPARARRDDAAPEKRGYAGERRPARSSTDDRPAFRRERDSGERSARPRRDDAAPEKRGYAGERRPAPRSSTDERPAFRRERDSGERSARPRRDDAAPEKRGYAGERRPARSNTDDRPTFRRERDSSERPARPRRDDAAPEKRSYAGERRPAPRSSTDDRPAFRRERDSGERPARPRRDGAVPEKRSYAGERRPARASTDDRPASERRVARPVKAAQNDRAGDHAGRERQPRARTDATPPRAASPSARRSGDETGLLRLAKRMSELGLCSRREADEWIEKGWVYVDGERIDTLGAKITPDQKIEIDPAAHAAQARLVTVLLHKPVGYVSGQAEDGYEPAVTLVTKENHWEGDRSGLRFSAQHLRALAPAGRLDIDSTGLLVLTQDGRIAKQLIGEQSDVDKEYLVRVTYGDIETDIDQHFPPESLAKLRHGLSLDDVPLKPAMVSWQNGEQLRFVLREGKKRQIRRMCELVGLKVVGLKRVRMGRVQLGALPQGQWRYLTPEEAF
jgi:23S rRNA pseudouridine2604 synthase